MMDTNTPVLLHLRKACADTFEAFRLHGRSNSPTGRPIFLVWESQSRY